MADYDFDGYGGFPRYVSVAERRAKALKQARKLEKRGRMLEPVVLAGQRIASSFWGKEWCKNLESYMDFSNRLPRGRTYVRSGAVVDLRLGAGQIDALVGGDQALCRAHRLGGRPPSGKAGRDGAGGAGRPARGALSGAEGDRLHLLVPRLRLALQAHRRSALRSRRAARREARAVLHAAQRGPRGARGKERAPPRTAGEGGSRHGLPGGNFRDRTGSEAAPPRAVRRSPLVARTSPRVYILTI